MQGIYNFCAKRVKASRNSFESDKSIWDELRRELREQENKFKDAETRCADNYDKLILSSPGGPSFPFDTYSFYFCKDYAAAKQVLDALDKKYQEKRKKYVDSLEKSSASKPEAESDRRFTDEENTRMRKLLERIDDFEFNCANNYDKLISSTTGPMFSYNIYSAVFCKELEALKKEYEKLIK